MTTNARDNQAQPRGAQRCTLERLRDWEALGYGMFLHFGMSTYDGLELSLGDKPASWYSPDKLDVEQWVSLAAEAGMRYAVLTAKHVSGFCLWPSDQTDYHVGHSANTTDVVEAFVRACEKHGLMAGLYYCSWDNHHRFGSVTPTFAQGHTPYTTEAYRAFQRAQVEELLTRYGPVGEVWIDIPKVLGHEGRQQQYQQIAELAPDAVIMMNHGVSNGSALNPDQSWPTDLMAIERFLPSSNRGYNPWFTLTPPDRPEAGEASYYIPGEVCDPIGYEWFHDDDDTPRSDGELLGMRLIARQRGTNLLLNVPPDRTGRIPDSLAESLRRLRVNLETFDHPN